MSEGASLQIDEERAQEKIVSLREVDLLEKHSHALESTLYRMFGKELGQTENLDTLLPLIKWTECTSAPSAFSLFLLTQGTLSQESELFFHEMISLRLIREEKLHILSSRNLLLHDRGGGRHFYFVELLVQVEKEQQLPLIKKNLPYLVEEIRVGLFSSKSAKHVLEMKRFSSMSSKSSYVSQAIIKLMRRFPKNFDQDIFRTIQYFFSTLSEEFLQLRSEHHLSRMIVCHYIHQKMLQSQVKAYPMRRHLHFKLYKNTLDYPFGLKKVVSMTITLNSLRENECFEERHILQALQRIYPNISLVPGSFNTLKSEQLCAFYLEFEKTNGQNFTDEEIKELKRALARELKNSIEYRSSSLFIPRNEEELYRNIVILSQELKYIRDLPQAVISFKEQEGDLLKFDVILLRVLQKTSKSLHEMAQALPSSVSFSFEKKAKVGLVRNRYQKEANVFTLAVDSRLFLRQNHSVDLVRARQYVVKMLEGMIGAFRDYNGGFLRKQNEELEEIKKELMPEIKSYEHLVENIFFSFTPSIFQTLVPTRLAKELFLLFFKMIDSELIGEYALEKRDEKEGRIIVIKGEKEGLKEALSSSLKEILMDNFNWGTSSIELDGHTYLFYVYLDPEKEEIALIDKALQKGLMAFTQKERDINTIRIHLPRAAQSLDPRIGADRTSGVIIKMLYEGLYRTSKDGTVEAALAEDVEISPDFRTYTFHLRNSFWSNGSPLTAYDFEYAWKKILDPSFYSAYVFLFFPIKNARLAKKKEIPLSEVGIRALDAKTLVVELEHSAPYFLGLTSHWTYSPLCQEIDQKHPGWAYQSGDTYVCNGPFKLNHWKINDDLEVVKNPLFWDQQNVKLQKIEVKIIEDSDIAMDLFHKGALDWFGDPMTRIPPAKIASYKNTPFFEERSLSGLFWLQLNLDKPPFNSKSIRKALCYAIDRKKLSEDYFLGEDEPALSLVREEKSSRNFIKDGDIEEAKRLFQVGLKELNLTLDQLPTILFSHSDIDEHEIITRQVGLRWTQLFGIKVRYQRFAWNDYFKHLSSREFMLGGLTWYTRYDDPVYYLDLLISDELKTFVTTWKNESFKSIVTQIKEESNLIKRGALVEEADRIAMEEMPLIPLLVQKWRYIKNPRLKDVILSNVGQMDFRNAYLEPSHV